MVLGFAMCATMAFAQTSNSQRYYSRVDQTSMKVSANPGKVDYKASIFAKDANFDTLHTFRFTEAEWSTGTDTIVRGYIQSTDHINISGRDSVFGSHANNTNVNVHPWNQWRRFSDTNDFKNRRASLYSNFYIGEGNVLYFASDSVNMSDPEWDNDGFVLFSYDEGRQYASDWVNTYMEMPAVQRDATHMGSVVFVNITQLYRKYYDQCFIDYQINGTWYAREVNVDGVDMGVNDFGAIKARFAMPNNLVNESTIKIRFRVSSPQLARPNIGWPGYAWAIDNVAIATNNRSESWEFSFNEPLDGFYGTIPQGMTIPVSYGAQVRNTSLTSINNAGLTLSAGPLGSPLTEVFTNGGFNIPAGDVIKDYKMYLDERGFVNTGDTQMFNDPYRVTIWYGNQNYGRETLIGNYQGRSLPTTNPGANMYKITAAGGSQSTRLDSILYTVSRQLVFSDENGVNGYRWGRDNGLIPSNSVFNYAVTPDGYITDDDEESHTTSDGYSVMVSYVTGSVIPTTNGEKWRLKGIEIVPSTDGTSYPSQGALVPRVYVETYADGDYSGFTWNSVALGVDGLAFDVPESAFDNLPEVGYTLPPTGNVANYSAVNIFFPNQPELLPNTAYHIGYMLNEDQNFRVASQSTSYRLNDSTIAYYNYDETAAPYRQQNYPLSGYDVYVTDPIATGNGASSFSAGNINFFPMIRAIVGPAEDVPTVVLVGDCTTNTADSAISISLGNLELCGERSSVAVGGNYSVVISAAEDHTVLDNVLVNGEVVAIYDPNDPEHAEQPTTPYYVRYYNNANQNDNVEDEQGRLLLARGYYVLYFDEIPASDQGYAISATFHTEEWMAVGIDPMAPEASLALYPNPATSTVKLNIKGVSGMVDCSIIDMSGRVVYNATVNAEAENTINVANMPAGAYFVRITNNTFSKIEKLIIK